MKLYVDMDGVLADFDGQVRSKFSDIGSDEKVSDYINRIGKDKFWHDVEAIDDFWISIPPLQDKLPELFKSLRKRFPHIMILTAPARDPNCIPQKKEWIEKHIGPGVMSLYEKDKYIYACPKSILIDDTESKINDWNGAGGIGILFTEFDDALFKKLNDLSKND